MNLNAPTKAETTITLKSIEALMRLGKSLFESIELQSEIEEGKIKKILQKIIFLVEKKNVSIEKALKDNGIIDKNEYLVLSKSKETREAFVSIISMREIDKNFNKTLKSLLLFPIIGTYIGLAIAYFVVPIIMKPINDIILVAKESKGINVENAMNIPEIFFYVNHPDWIPYIAIALTLVIAGFIFFLKYFEKKNVTVIYKVFPLKAYDDIPFIFILMRALNKGGSDLYSISKMLHKSDLNKTWLLFFYRMTKQIESNKPINVIFKNFGFPKQIHIVIKSAEHSKAFWDIFDNMIAYAKDINKIKNKAIVDNFKGISTVAAYIIIFYFVIGLILITFGMQSLIMALK